MCITLHSDQWTMPPSVSEPCARYILDLRVAALHVSLRWTADKYTREVMTMSCHALDWKCEPVDNATGCTDRPQGRVAPYDEDLLGRHWAASLFS